MRRPTKTRGELEREALVKYRKLAARQGVSEQDATTMFRRVLGYNSDSSLREFLRKPLKSLDINSLDPGHDETNRIIHEAEKEISKDYERAADEMEAKAREYLRKFEAKDEAMRKKVASGKMTPQEYKQWRMNAMATGKRWQEMADSLAQDAQNTSDIARSTMYGHMPEAYAVNRNFGTFQVEHDSMVDTSYTLYDRQTVERLWRKHPNLMPDPSPRTISKIQRRRAVQWDKRKVQAELVQGILQGESIPDIAKRMRNVAGMEQKQSVRAARTMMTSAENAGRLDAFKDAKSKGINLKKQWLATLDQRTRPTHRQLDGAVADLDAEFDNGCMQPGDPNGEPAEVYNCRCTMLATLNGFAIDASDLSLRGNNDLGDMTYEEWKGIKAGDIMPKETPVLDSLNAAGVARVHADKWSKKPTSGDIVKLIAGADKTGGSCSSLAFAYAGNRGGKMIRDFRGGKSQDWFMQLQNIDKVRTLPGVKSWVEKDVSDLDAVHRLVKNVEPGKEYYLQTGRHAAVIRKKDDKFEYLEMQSARRENTWYELGYDELRSRFRAQRTHSCYGSKYAVESRLIDVESLANNKEFMQAVEFINTEEGKEKKGKGGGEK